MQVRRAYKHCVPGCACAANGPRRPTYCQKFCDYWKYRRPKYRRNRPHDSHVPGRSGEYARHPRALGDTQAPFSMPYQPLPSRSWYKKPAQTCCWCTPSGAQPIKTPLDAPSETKAQNQVGQSCPARPLPILAVHAQAARTINRLCHPKLDCHQHRGSTCLARTPLIAGSP